MTTEDSRLRLFRDVLYEAFAGSGRIMRDASPLDQLARLTARYSDDPVASPFVRPLDEVARQSDIDVASAVAETNFGTPERFNDAIHFVRWLQRDLDTSLELAQARRYVEEAGVSPTHAELHTDAASVLQFTSFAHMSSFTATSPPAAAPLRAALGVLSTWRSRYAATYLRAHQQHNRSLATIADTIDGIAIKANAVERLNGLRRLGPPVALAALEQFRDLERVYACSIDSDELARQLETSPFCAGCGFRLDDVAPLSDTRRVRQAIERGLISQQRRLAQRVVGRLLAQPPLSEADQLTRFVQMVQASDLDGMALVLDDIMVDFLRALLEPQTPDADFMQRLAESYPELTLANLDAAVVELRRLLQVEVVRAGGALRLGRAR